MRLYRLTMRARQRSKRGWSMKTSSVSTHDVRTVTRLQSIKCVRLLWLMHYEAIKNGNYSAVVSAACAPAPACSRTLSRTGPHSMLDEYERCCSMHCSEYNVRRYADDTRTTAKHIPDSRRSVATFRRDLHGVLCTVRNHTPLMLITWSSWENLLHLEKWTFGIFKFYSLSFFKSASLDF